MKTHLLFYLLSFISFGIYAHSPIEEILEHRERHLDYVENKGQWHPNVLYKANIQIGAVFLEKTGFTYNVLEADKFLHGEGQSQRKTSADSIIKGHAFQVLFDGANPHVSFENHHTSQEAHSYFLTNNISEWASEVPLHKEVVYKDIYKGIDCKVYSDEMNLKYDFIVSPKAKPTDIALVFNGLNNLHIQNGQLVMQTCIGDIIEQKPYAYQYICGQRKEVACRFKLKENRLSFDFPNGYNTRYPLVIDPTVIFSTYSGSISDNFGFTATFDNQGNAYGGGIVFGPRYPTTIGAYQTIFSGGEGAKPIDIAITKYAADGSTRLYSTYIGGEGNEAPHSLVVNDKGELFIMGTTGSFDFPTTDNAYDRSHNGGSTRLRISSGILYGRGSDIFISKLSADGMRLLSSTYVGGSGDDGLNIDGRLRYNYSDESRGEIILDEQNNVYVATSTLSADFPIREAFQPTFGGQQDGVLFKMDGDLTTLFWSSFLGGSRGDALYSISRAVDNSFYVAGGTHSIDYPTTLGVVQPDNRGGRSEGVITRISADGQRMLASTYWGYQAYDQVYFVETDRVGKVYLFGQTQTGDSMIVHADYSNPNSGQFISKLSSNFDEILWSTAFGNENGFPNISPTAFLVDLCDRVFVSGWGGKSNEAYASLFSTTRGLPITPDAAQSTTDGSDFYFFVLQEGATAPTYASFFGGPLSKEHVDGGTSRFDRNGIIYQSVCAGCGGNSDLPIFPHADDVVSPVNRSIFCNQAIIKFDFDMASLRADFDLPDELCAPTAVDFNYVLTDDPTTRYAWDFGNGQTSSLRSPRGIRYDAPGVYSVKLILSDPTKCNIIDSIVKQVVVLGLDKDTLPTIRHCASTLTQMGLSLTAQPGLTYRWSPSAGLSNPNIINPIVKPQETTNYQLIISNGVCQDTLIQRIEVFSDYFSLPSLPEDTLFCGGDSLSLRVLSLSVLPNLKYEWEPEDIVIFGRGTDSVRLVLTDTVALKLTVSDGEECVFRDTLQLNVHSDKVNIRPINGVVCRGDTINVALQHKINPFTKPEYQWTVKPSIDGIVLNQSNLRLVLQDTTTLGLQTTVGHCRYANSTLIPVFWFDGPLDTLDRQQLCLGLVKGIQLGSEILDAPSYTHFSWTPSASLDKENIKRPLATPNDTTTYTLRYSDGRCFDTLRQTVDVYKDDITISATDRVCQGDRVMISVRHQNESPVNPSYRWRTTPTASIPQNRTEVEVVLIDSTFIRLQTTAAETCVYTDSLFIPVSPISQVSSRLSNVLYCVGLVDGIPIGSTHLDRAPYSVFEWTPSQGVDKMNRPYTLARPMEATDYMLVYGDGRCFDTLRQRVDVYKDSIFILPADIVCQKDTTELQVRHVGSSTPEYTWHLHPSIITSPNSDIVQIVATPNQWYRVQANIGGCVYLDSIHSSQIIDTPDISVQASPHIIERRDIVKLLVRSERGVPPFIWSPHSSFITPTDIPNPEAQPMETAIYRVSVADKNGCKAKGFVRVEVIDRPCELPNVFIPNAFTPNGDGKNDVLYVRGDIITDVYFAVYDRWGQRVFETRDKNKGWDGMYKGTELSGAVFAYYAEVICEGGIRTLLRGNVTLIR